MDFQYQYGTELKFAAITVDTTIDADNLQYWKGLDIRQDWEDWFDEQVSASQEQVKQREMHVYTIRRHGVLYALLPTLI